MDLRRSILEAQVLQYLAPGRVTDAQVREFYRKMSRGEDARVRVVRLEYRTANESPEERDVAFQRAQAASKRLRTGADPSSIDDDSEAGPSEFEVGRGDIQPVLEDRIFAAKAGQIVGPVSTGRGYVVLKVLEQMDADVLPFEEAKDRIRQQLEFEAQRGVFGGGPCCQRCRGAWRSAAACVAARAVVARAGWHWEDGGSVLDSPCDKILFW